MNNTKWNEIFRAFYENELKQDSSIIMWRTKDIVPGIVEEDRITVFGYRTDVDYI